jgi:hypothetical protein
MAMTIERSPSNLHPISRAFIRDGRRSSIRQLHRRNAINRTIRSIGSPDRRFGGRLDPIPSQHILESAAWRRRTAHVIFHLRTRYPWLVMPSTRNTIDSRGRTTGLAAFCAPFFSIVFI